MNQDILAGSLGNSQSLNRYSYTQGNPVSYTDPFGLSPLSGEFTGATYAHVLYGLLGCVPGPIGIFANLADAILYAAEGNVFMAIMSGLSCVTMGASMIAKSTKVCERTASAARCVQHFTSMVASGANFTKGGYDILNTIVQHEQGTEYNFEEKLTIAIGAVMCTVSGVSLSLEGNKFDAALRAYRAQKGSRSIRTFYTVQSSKDVKRLLGNGTPWPTGETSAHLGEGVYAWGKKEKAIEYYNRLSNNTNDLHILEFDVLEEDLQKMKKIDLTLLTDDEATEFLSKYSKLFGGTMEHDYDYIIRGTWMGEEHYFNKAVFAKLIFKQ